MSEMRVNLPGLVRDVLPSGRVRWRVRVKGDKDRRITLPMAPGEDGFTEAYEAARRGGASGPAPQRESEIPRSVAWLTRQYEQAMQRMVAADLMHPSTAHQRRAFYERLRAEYGAKHMDMPRSAVVQLRDKLTETPGAADNLVKAIRALYAWAIDHGHVAANPAAGVARINQGRGAVPWSVKDLQAFRDRHAKGSMAHLALTLFMFTACRIGDAYRLGRGHERKIDGITYLDFQPDKRGSARVIIPILPPLAEAIAAQTVVGPTYLLSGWGRPFASSAAFGNWFRDRVREAGLENRSPHGIRKAAGELMALEGASQYHIMAVHGHTQAKTSEGYTQGVNRQKLAAEAMKMLAGMDW